MSVALHLGLLAAVLSVGPEPQRFAEPDPMPVSLVAPRLLPTPPPTPEPKPDPEPAPPKPPAAVKPPPTLKARKPLPAPPEVRPLAVAPAKVAAPGDEVSDAEVASAATAGGGGGGAGGQGSGGCDMARLLQDKLRSDHRVRAALAGVPGGRTIRVWNGDWVRHGEQEGAGLAAVREAIMWEVAWAPEACRKQPVRGLVLLTLNEGPPPARVLVGTGAWRWSDLLFSRSTRPKG